MFQFRAKFLTQKPTTTTDTPKGDAVKPTATNAPQSRLMLERQRRARNVLQPCDRCRSAS